jgi:integrase
MRARRAGPGAATARIAPQPAVCSSVLPLLDVWGRPDRAYPGGPRPPRRRPFLIGRVRSLGGTGQAALRSARLRHAHALEVAREGVPLNIIQRQLGHADLGTTSIYLQGIDPEEIIATVHMRRAPMMPASAGLRL